jgi:hypothetical protein
MHVVTVDTDNSEFNMRNKLYLKKIGKQMPKI